LALALDTAAHGCKRTLAAAVIVESLGDGELAATALFGAPCRRLLRRGMTGAALRLFIFLGFGVSQFLAARTGRCRRTFSLTPPRFVDPPAACLLVGAATRGLFRTA